MTDKDFTDCKFITDRMTFVTYDDFVKDALLIKNLYEQMRPMAKQFYKWYVYANIHTDLLEKNIIWDFLNGDSDIVRVIMHQKKKKA